MKSENEPTNGHNVCFRLFLATIAICVYFLSVQATCFAYDLKLAWDANTEPDIAGYNVYYKEDSSSLPFNGIGSTEGASPINVHDQTTTTISGLDPSRTYYIAVTAYNTSGLESPYSNIVTSLPVNNPPPDTTAPNITAFTMPATATSLTVPITSFTAQDNVAVTGYLVNESAVQPAANAVGWTAAAPTSFTFSSAGNKTAYAWAKDAAGNVSNGVGSSLVITVPGTPLNINDALRALKITVGTVIPTNDDFTRLDVAPVINGQSVPDGKITIDDVVKILSRSIGV